MAANRSLGTLTLDLIAKIGGFTDALDKASRETDRRLSAIEKRAEQFSDSIKDSIKDAIGAIGITLTVGGFLEGIKEAVNHMDELGKSAAKVDLPVEEFSTLAGAAKLSNVQMDNLTETLGRLTKAQATALDQNSEQAKLFKALGISVTDADGRLRKSSDVLKDFADRFQELHGSPEIIAAGIDIFGKSFQDLIPFLQNGSEGIANAQQEAAALGSTLDKEAAEGAAHFNDNLTKLQIATENLFGKIAERLLPSLNDWTDSTVELAKDNKGLDRVASAVTDTMTGLAVVAHALAAAFYLIEASIQTVVAGATAGVEQAQALGKIIAHTATLGQVGPEYKKAWSDLTNAGQVAADQVQFSWKEAMDKIDGSFKAIQGIINGTKKSTKSLDQDTGKPKKAPAGLADRLTAALSKPDQEAINKANALADAWGKLNEAVQKVSESANPNQKAYNDFADTVRNIDRLAADAIKKGADVADVQKQVAAAVSSAQQKLSTDLAKPMKAAQAYADVLDQELQARKDLIQSQVDAIGMGSKEAENQQELIKVRQDGLKAIAALQKQYETHPESYTEEQYQAELTKTKQHWEDMEQAVKDGQDKITAAQADWTNGLKKGYSDWLAQTSDVAAQWDQITSDALNNATDALASFLDGSKSAKDAFSDFIDSTEAAITRFVAQQLLKQLLNSIFGDGSNQQGGGGKYGWVAQAIGSIFGGGKATGGAVAAGSMYRVNEKGPELLSVGGRDFLMMGDRSGRITPSHQVGGRSVTQTNNFFLAAPTTQKTQTQIAQRNAYEMRRAQRLS